MPIRRRLAAAGLIGLCVGLPAILGSALAEDAFAALSMLGAYVMVLAAILGGVVLALALSAGAVQLMNLGRKGQAR